MKVRDQIILQIILPITFLLLIMFFAPLESDAFLNYIPIAFGQQQSNSLYQSEVSTINNDISTQKVKVGDIEIAYKQIGNSSGTPIILISGCCTTLDMWSPTLLKELSENQKVIIFDNRGVGNSTLGTKPFSIKQFANDTLGLLDALKVQKADIFGISMGSYIAQELTLMNPTRIGNLVLAASICGGDGAIPPRAQVIEAIDAMTDTSIPTQEEIDRITATLFPPNWFKANPNYQEYIPQAKEPVSPEIIQRQTDAIVNWSAIGTCDALSNITQPTLVIVGTDDIWTPPANSMMIAERIPGAWLVQMRDAGHGIIYQYPNEFSRVVSTFLQIAN
jgi:pimeloyl-ACP methyl ester carboxylesterase